MKIAGKEIHFAFTIGAQVAYQEYEIANPGVSAITKDVHLAMLLSQAWAKNNGGDKIESFDELDGLPFYMYLEMVQEMKEAIARDSTRTVETVEKKPTKK